MSRVFHMEIMVCDLPATDKTGRAKVADVVSERIEVEELENDEHYILEGNKTLSGGMMEDEWIVELSHALWEALGCYKLISVVATDLTRAPYETHTAEEDDYDDWRRAQR